METSLRTFIGYPPRQVLLTSHPCTLGRELGRTYPARDVFIRNINCLYDIGSLAKRQNAAIKPTYDRHPPATYAHWIGSRYAVIDQVNSDQVDRLSDDQNFPDNVSWNIRMKAIHKQMSQ